MKHGEILKKYGISAKKSLGQNFLINDTILDVIADSVPVQEKNIIEVGPGYGALTEKLLDRNPLALDLVELDTSMIDILNHRISEKDLIVPWGSRLTIHHLDVLKFLPTESEYSLIANIPYYITSPILYRFLYEVEQSPEYMVILMQKEVGDKIRKGKGYGNSYLSLFIEYRTEEVKEIMRVAAGNFIPPPKVESAVLLFKVKKEYDRKEAQELLRVLRAWFSAPRKKVISNLSAGLALDKWELEKVFKALWHSESIRAEDLSLEQWMEVYHRIYKK